MPVALYTKVEAGARTVEPGVTAIETSVAALTVRGTEPVTPPRVALIFAVPGATAVESPTLMTTVATPVASDTQDASEFIVWVVESLNRAVAVNPSLLPGAIVRPAGVTEMELTVAVLTVRLADAFVEPSVAVMNVLPDATALASPLPTPMVAIDLSKEIQVTCPVRLRVPPSLKVPTAKN